MIRKFQWMSLVLLGMFSIETTFANVSLRNGNFYIGYTDVLYPGGFEPKVERVYNSKTPFNGIFGWGWGTDLEVYLTVVADGSVVVNEYGGGAQNRFAPRNFDSKELERAVESITQVARQSGAIPTAAELKSYQSKLRSDAFFRNQEWQKYLDQGKIKPRQLPDGTQLYSNRFAFQYITKVKGGYVRVQDGGKIERFSEQGKLVRVEERNKNFLELTYTKDGLLSKIQDNQNRKIFFTFNTKRKVERIQAENNQYAQYQYNELGELVQSRDTDGNIYRYKYSSDQRHNLVEVAYSDNSTLQIAYYGRDQLENVKSVRERDGTLTSYAYKQNGESQLAVDVNVKNKEGKLLTQSRYEYTFKNRADGEEWTQRLVSTVDGYKTDTIYHEKFGLPVVIRSGEDETRFQYDPKGRVVEKVTPYEVTKLKYNDQVGKVSRVEKLERSKGAKANWSEFQYDSQGNLTIARNSEGKGVKLVYERSGKIAAMIDQSKRQLTFKYDANAKPIEIRDSKLGAITVQYNNAGEVLKVDSAGGRKVAQEVSMAFQNLLDIIRPAGVSLSI